MIITIELKLKKASLTCDYRPALVSLIKASLQEYDESLYRQWYDRHNKTSKSFTFAVRLPDAKFTKDIITLGSNEIGWGISTADFSDGIDLYNALLARKGKAYPIKDNNEFTIEKCRVQNQQIISEKEITIKMLSPLVVRNHGNDNKDKYYTYDDTEFNEMLNMVTDNRLKLNNLTGSTKIRLTPIEPKKTVVKTFGLAIRASLGVYRLTGNAETLNYLYQSGMASRRNLGFGMFEIL